MRAQRIHSLPEFFHCSFEHLGSIAERFGLGFKTIENEEMVPPVKDSEMFANVSLRIIFNCKFPFSLKESLLHLFLMKMTGPSLLLPNHYFTVLK